MYEYLTLNYTQQQQKDLIEQWYQHLDEVFTQTPKEYFVQHHENDPSRQQNVIFIATDLSTKKIVSTVKLFTREMFINGDKCKVAGIGEVSTKPEHRGQGLSSKLLEMAHQYLTNNGYMLSFLFSNKYSAMYHSKGWSYVHRDITVEDVNEKIVPESDGHSLLLERMDTIDSTTLESYFQILVEQKPIDQQQGSIVRSIQYWKEWIIHNVEPHSKGTIGWVAKDSSTNTIVGHIITSLYGENSDTMAVKDLGSIHNKTQQNTCIKTLIKLTIRQYQTCLLNNQSIKYVQYPSPLLITSVLGGEQTHKLDKSMMVRLCASNNNSVPSSSTTCESLFPLDSVIYWDIDKL
ncbi:hypothetical protein SAMD00019534_113090 [Acytostelium subglobosum LB1]|uniref:hypothetical protein n=1 Tax=Acytostelium subglobosum LB1 TaxID=1410327 RepID=UPI000644C651|nr:hypothetical protein SAMD00019534_113090 [Acytostelium subglobosum LB1]GAM28133.1 hypothetical protein SAMD00019534_113090 [Acytostelium subglobosum LB1]|eukprot:XP_012748767.1 hypothetical protein SAMD00019534_113090 [Acytostelium subglobosum LB1]